MSLRIGIDYTAAAFEKAGIGRSVREVTRALVANHSAQWKLFVAGRRAALFDLPAQVDISRSPFSERTHNRVWHRLRLPVHVEWWTGGLDIWHSANFTLAPARTKSIVTIYDLAFERFPADTMPGMHAFLTQAVPRAAHRADHIIAISEATKQDLVELYGTPAHKITVIPLGVRPRFTPQTDESDERIRTTYRLPAAPFALTVGTLQPRKNHRRLVQALSHLPPEYHLVIAGGSGWAYEGVRAEVEKLGLGKRVTFAGFVADDDLPALYRAADVFVYPSLYEGFGLPILEAMACGTPVVASNTSSLPEVVGEAGLLVDPYQPEAIAEGITKAHQNEGLHAAGLSRAADYSWAHAAERHMQVYESLA